jgi:hypothetical protein
MSARATRRAIRRSGASAAMLDEIVALRRHNAALSLFLRGAIRAHGGLGRDPRLVIAKALLDMPRDRIVATPMEDRVVLSLEPDPAATSVDQLLPTEDVPWGS